MIPHIAYMAAAGSGKTFALSARYVGLLFLGESPGSILAATFTNKAAAEMRERVVESLQTIGLNGNEAFLNRVIYETGLSKEIILEKKEEVFQRFLKSSSHIVTLDSFFTSILRSSSLEIGIEPDFVMKERASDSLETMFLEEIESNGLLNALVKLTLDIEDKRFKKILGVMQDLYKQDALLLRQEYKDFNLQEIEDKINAIRENILELVKKSGASATAINNFNSMDVKEFMTKDIFKKESLYEHRNYKKYLDGFEQIETYFQELKIVIKEYFIMKQNIIFYNLFKSYGYYKNAKISMVKSENILGFDDLNYFTYRLLHETINKDFLYFKLDTKFKHILLDEFQDTSTLQFLLLKPLIDEIFDGVGQNDFRTFFYVGDTKQSLYRFRGGAEELFNLVSKRYGIEIKEMDTNYRSSQNVVKSVNKWFSKSFDDYVPQKVPDNTLSGYVEVKESMDLLKDAILEARNLLTLGIKLDQIAFLVQTNKDGQKLQELCYIDGLDVRLKTSSSLKSVPKIASLVAMVKYLYGGVKLDAQAILTRTSKSFDDINLDWFNVFLSPFNILDNLIKELHYYENDANVLKLLEFSSQYSDIPTFLEEFEESRIDIASSSKHGAQIMTVHGSKGLEFDYVILVDKLTKQPPDNSLVLYDYDSNLNIKQIVLRQSKQENFNQTYKELKANQEVLVKKDRLNVLYVALTRAALGMVILKDTKQSIFESLEMQVECTGKVEQSTIEENIIEEQERILTIENYGLQNIVTHQEYEDKDLEAILFGTALHYTLEILNNFTLEALKIAIYATENRYGKLLRIGELEDIENRVINLIEDNTFQSYLDGAVVRKEQSISFSGDMKQIDLLLEYKDHNLVIDYKSSKKFMDKHKDQVKYYQDAVESITSKETKGLIVYLLKDKIEILSLK